MRFWKQTVEESSEQKASQGNAVEESGGRVGDVETAIEGRPNSHHEKQPTLRFTAHQAFYIFGLDGVGAAVLSGGINFGIAYGEFNCTSKPLVYPPPGVQASKRKLEQPAND